MFIKISPKSTNIWATFVKKLSPRTTNNRPIWSHWLLAVTEEFMNFIPIKSYKFCSNKKVNEPNISISVFEVYFCTKNDKMTINLTIETSKREVIWQSGRTIQIKRRLLSDFFSIAQFQSLFS